MISFLSGCLAQSAIYLASTMRNQDNVHKRKLHIMAGSSQRGSKVACPKAAIRRT